MSNTAGLPAHWGRFVILGVALLLLGLLALGNLLVATVVSVFFVGAVMMVGGISQIVLAFREKKSWGGFALWMIGGILYALAGFIAFYNPLLAASALTVLLAFVLLASGIARVISGFQFRPTSGWGWIVASGVVTALAGVLVLIGWPINTLWLLGLVLAIDLIFQGVFAATFGFALKSRR